MKALVLCAFAVALVGCGAPEAATPALSTHLVQIGLPRPQPVPMPPECVDETFFIPIAHDPNDDPWAGLAPGFVVSTPYTSRLGQVGFIVYGFEKTLTTVVWYRNVLTQDDVDFYSSAAVPGTLPFNCPTTVSLEIGQIGSIDVPGGSDGGNTPRVNACADETLLAPLRKNCLCQPNPDPCGAAECGSKSDGCFLTYQCGSCDDGLICATGRCVSPKKPPPVICKPECI